MKAAELTQALKAEAAQLGFQLAGVCPAIAPPGFRQFADWLDADFSGEMSFLPKRRNAYRHPESVLDEVKYILMLGMDYSPQLAPTQPSGTGRVARYAVGGSDYHDLIHQRLKRLGRQLTTWQPDVRWRGVVDTAPLLEREFAQLAGLGWQGKNTMLISPHRGSWFVLAALLVDCELVSDEPLQVDHCGTCRMCLDACPTQAFVAPRVLDARRCISYLTIEHRSSIPDSLREFIGSWVFGCDVCQEVCPWNRFASEPSDPVLQPRPELNPIDLPALFSLTEQEFRERFRATPLWRAKRRGLLRNAAIVLGNQRDPIAIPALTRGLNDIEPLVRGASAWALRQMPCPTVDVALTMRKAIESDPLVLLELP